MITKDKIECVLNELEVAAKEIGKKYNIDCSRCSASYSMQEVTMNIFFRDVPDDGTDPAQAEWNRYIRFTSLRPDDFGKEIIFPYDKHTYKIIGYNPKARKNKIIVRREYDGKEYVVSVDAILEALGR